MNTPLVTHHESLSTGGLSWLCNIRASARIDRQFDVKPGQPSGQFSNRFSNRFSRQSKLPMRGFSLLEVLLVLVLAGILMGVVATSLSDGPVLRKSAREVAASLRHARSIAILQQKSVVWSMNIQSREFWVQGRNKDAKRDFHDSISAKINTAASEVVSSSQGNIRFFPDGSSTGGSVELTARKQTYKVNVEWISGRVSVL